MSAHTEPQMKRGDSSLSPGNHIWAQRSLQFTINACSRISCHMGIMYYIYIWKYDNDTTKHGWVFPPPSPKTTVIYSASIHMLCTCWCACVHVCVRVHVCVGLSGAHTQIENMFGSPFGMFSLSFPHLMLLICMQQVCRWRHLDANTHTHTHIRAYTDTYGQGILRYTHARHTHTHTKASTCTLTLAWRVSCFNTHLAKFWKSL